VLVLGAGAGASVWLAKKYGASRVDAVEVNPAMPGLLARWRPFAGDVYHQPGVRLFVADARRHLADTAERYDLIELALALTGNVHAQPAGMEAHLYTVEAVRLYLRHLTPTGALVLIHSDPGNAYRQLLTVIDALETLGVSRAHALRTNGYQTTKESIAADAKTANAACDKLAGNANDVCEAQVKGDQNVALAELEYRHSGTEADRAAVAMAKSDAAFSVAKEMCDDKVGNAKDVCLKQADAVHVKANAQAKLSKADADAQNEADSEGRNADYQVAIEKCDALAGDTKDACIAESKAKFAKN